MCDNNCWRSRSDSESNNRGSVGCSVVRRRNPTGQVEKHQSEHHDARNDVAHQTAIASPRPEQLMNAVHAAAQKILRRIEVPAHAVEVSVGEDLRSYVNAVR